MATPEHTRCSWFDKGYCWRGEDCHYRHEPPVGPVPSSSMLEPEHSEDEDVRDECGICFEIPAMYGLLDCCTHTYCLGCLRRWRSTRDKSKVQIESSRKCPQCRREAKLITPSRVMLREGFSKECAMENYLAIMAKIPCKHYELSGLCKFGTDCHYLHERSDGTPHVFHHTHAEYLAAEEAAWISRQAELEAYHMQLEVLMGEPTPLQVQYFNSRLNYIMGDSNWEGEEEGEEDDEEEGGNDEDEDDEDQEEDDLLDDDEQAMLAAYRAAREQAFPPIGVGFISPPASSASAESGGEDSDDVDFDVGHGGPGPAPANAWDHVD